ncbi:DUF4396 domain-containing protein [Dyella jejuensis]|uniref:DUF4396 domain-containing protein n=1 Tax=Dyella jejuensis TaxID=1432009 RepID=A0ABW8JKX5_9GAMM
MHDVSQWLHLISLGSLGLSCLCAVVIAEHVSHHPQRMGVMNGVWPIAALFGSVFVLYGYFRHGVQDAREVPDEARETAPFPIAVAKGTLHCGSGCMVGDVVAESLLLLFPSVAVVFGWHWLFQDRMFATWVLDFLFAFAAGIFFQYFAIVPMRKLSPQEGVRAALKADSLSLAAWQVGMYAVMGFAQRDLFARVYGGPLPASRIEFWLAMQVAMIGGFITAYPVNAWLIHAGIKEAM